MNDIAKKAHRGTLVLVFGILGLIVCMPLGIAAWIMGNSDLKEMDAGRMDDEGRSLTQVGKILGMISAILAIVVILLYAMIFILAVVAGASAN